jgi:hypothetical protein
LDNPLGKGEE